MSNFQEAFLTTYRTFIAPELLIAKLVYRWLLSPTGILRWMSTWDNFGNIYVLQFRFRKFSGPEHGSLRLSRAAFSLLVRVVDSLAEVTLIMVIVGIIHVCVYNNLSKQHITQLFLSPLQTKLVFNSFTHSYFLLESEQDCHLVHFQLNLKNE